MEGLKLEAILFDLDGTLIDTAPDVIAAINEVAKQRSLKTFKISELRHFVSEGAGALLNHAIGYHDEILLKEFRYFYVNNLKNKSKLFHGVLDVLYYLKVRQFKMGVVTNKPERLAEKLLKLFDLHNYFDCFVYGDTVENKKPHAEPLLCAAEMLNIHPSKCIYVGDHKHDVMAAKSAGMYSIAAEFGYIHPNDDIRMWQANKNIKSMFEIMRLLEGNPA